MSDGLTIDTIRQAIEYLKNADSESLYNPPAHYIFPPDAVCFECQQKLFDGTEIQAHADCLGSHVRCLR